MTDAELEKLAREKAQIVADITECHPSLEREIEDVFLSAFKQVQQEFEAERRTALELVDVISHLKQPRGVPWTKCWANLGNGISGFSISQGTKFLAYVLVEGEANALLDAHNASIGATEWRDLLATEKPKVGDRMEITEGVYCIWESGEKSDTLFQNKRWQRRIGATGKCICDEGFGMNLSCPIHGAPPKPSTPAAGGEQLYRRLRNDESPESTDEEIQCGRNRDNVFLRPVSADAGQDTKRLDWLDRKDVKIAFWNFNEQHEVYDQDRVIGHGKTVREAIDAAMREHGQEGKWFVREQQKDGK